MSGTRVPRLILRLGLILALTIGASAWAQSAATTAATAKAESLTVANKAYDAGKELPRMEKRYGLSAEQVKKIQPLLLEQQKQIHALGEDTSLTDAEWASAVRKVHQKTVAKVKLLLTDAQLSKYVQDELKRAKKSGNDSGDDDDDGPPFGPPPDGGPPGGPGGGPPGGGGPGGGAGM